MIVAATARARKNVIFVEKRSEMKNSSSKTLDKDVNEINSLLNNIN